MDGSSSWTRRCLNSIVIVAVLCATCGWCMPSMMGDQMQQQMMMDGASDEEWPTTMDREDTYQEGIDRKKLASRLLAKAAELQQVRQALRSFHRPIDDDDDNDGEDQAWSHLAFSPEIIPDEHKRGNAELIQGLLSMKDINKLKEAGRKKRS